ncbi:response regulator transcription factor [Ferrovibrio sp.]|jgi:two-component system response regulator FixJ|uniref:response regulator transcription factor n=1 Tax=Ferrovibrio sp. TaxID=1917215 RepID=UPI0035B0BC26
MTQPTVFIVDDDEFVRDSLAALLLAKGMEAVPFASAEAFLLGYRPVASGCAIIDMRMPGMDGLTLLEHLRNRNITLPVIVVTGHGDVPLAVRAMKAGAADFIEKPYTNTAILDAVAKTLQAAPAGMLPDMDVADARSRIASLTGRERDILQQLIIGNPNKVIAFQLSISPRTVEIHRANLMKKMNADSLSHLIRMALAAGFSGTD